MIEVEFGFVGEISDEDFLGEIERISRVAVVSQRMQKLPYDRSKSPAKKLHCKRSPNKVIPTHSIRQNQKHLFMVRGFN